MASVLEPLTLEFAGVVAVVAGGANGLGVAISKGLAEKGAQVYISGDVVENRKQICELSNVRRGICNVLPKQLSTDELLAEVAAREDNIHILVDDASAGWGQVFARTEAFFDMLSGSVDESDPSHIITIQSSAPSTGPWESKEANAENARAFAAEFSDECIVVNCIEPARNELELKNAIDMAMSLCSQPSLSGQSGASCVDNGLLPVPRHAEPFPLLQAKL